MKRTLFLQTLFFFLLAVGLSTSGFAQNPPLSPPASATGKIGQATVTINYGSPSVRGRKIFGGLQPYGKVWRAGANTATTIETDKDIMVEGKKLPAGKYTLFVTPSENDWTVILNSQTGQWGIKRDGEANRDPANDVLTVMVKPRKIEPLKEQLAYVFDKNGVALQWENVELPISIK